MNRPLPQTSAQWLEEIDLAIADASKAAPFAPMVGAKITAANLFHLAPIVCLKFRGRKLEGREADRVIKVALENYVAHADNELEKRPRMAFALCYVAAHLALKRVDEKTAEAILNDCDANFGNEVNS